MFVCQRWVTRRRICHELWTTRQRRCCPLYPFCPALRQDLTWLLGVTSCRRFDAIKRKGNVFLHDDLICTRYTLSKYITDIYVDSLCIISFKNVIMKSHNFCPSLLIYYTMTSHHMCLSVCLFLSNSKKGKGRALDIALRVDTEALGYMARTKQRHTYLPYIFPAIAGTHLPTPRGWRVE